MVVVVVVVQTQNESKQEPNEIVRKKSPITNTDKQLDAESAPFALCRSTFTSEKRLRQRYVRYIR